MIFMKQTTTEKEEKVKVVYWYTVDIDSHSSLLALQSSYPSIVIHFTVDRKSVV